MKEFEVPIPTQSMYEEMRVTFRQSGSYTPEEYAKTISEFLIQLYDNLPPSGAKKLANDERIQKIIKDLGRLVD